MRQGRCRGDEGTIMLLTIGYLVLILGLVAVVVDVSAVLLARRALAATCDGAALAAAQAVDTRSIYSGGGGEQVLPLGAVQDAVSRYPAPDGTRLTAAVAGSSQVTVSGRRTVRLPLVQFLGIGQVEVVASAQAETRRMTG
jgi:Flp pilus assembly protein TadG